MVKYNFYIHTYLDDPSRVVKEIELFHPSAKIILISDKENRLKNKSVSWITRWWDIARQNEQDIVVKVDPDSIILGPCTLPFPVADFFGDVISYRNKGEEEKQVIHGGRGQFLSMNFINTVYNQVTDEKFLNKQFMYKNNLIAVDKILAQLAKDNNFPLVQYNANIQH